MEACSTTGASRPIRKITVLGVGGVGGLLAGQLIRKYGDAVSLVARGARGEHLRQQGLTIHSDLYGEYTVQPAAVTADPAELGVQDLILVSVKYAQLETAAAQLAPIVGPDTLVLPVMNGVHTAAKLGRLLGKGRMLQSVIYVVSSAGADYSITQYGDYTTVSDMLDLTAIDDVVLEITDRHGSNMGLTLDTVTRNEIQQGKQVIYAPKIGSDGTKTDVTSRMTLDKDCRMTSELVAKAATQLKKMNAPTFDGKYVCIIHPSVAFDLRQDEAWIAAHQYAGATELFSGEIGELHGVRFMETTEAKIYRGEDLAADSRTLKVNGNVMASTDVTFNGGTVAAGALAGRYVVLGGTRCQVVSNTDAKLVLDKTVTVGDKEVIYPGEGGKQGCAVYGCLFLGKGAYGVVDLSEGTEVIVKPRGSSGTADPLDQRSSVGWKGVHAAAILYDEYMVRVECGSSYSDEDKAN